MALIGSRAKIAKLEGVILRALCALPDERGEWSALAGELADYHWQEPDHAVVFSALCHVRSGDPKTWRDHLAAQVTRMGFPDIDWGGYFPPDGTGRPEQVPTARRARK